MDKVPNGLKFGTFIEWIKKDDMLKADNILKEVAALKWEESKANKKSLKEQLKE
jgi:hypothetical protein